MSNKDYLKNRTWKISPEEKYRREVDKIVKKIQEAIITRDHKKYDKVVDLLSNCTHCTTTSITKELLVDVILNTINWIIETKNERFEI